MAGKPRIPTTPTSPTALNPLDAAVARVRSSDDFPAFAGRIHQLMAVLGEEDSSVQQLANLIVQDYSLTVKLLRVANSFRFNRSGAPVLSATHAIVMMGAEAVRDLATTIIVWEHFRRRAPGLRPLLMMSLLSANHARELAVCVGTVPGEEAYLVGMLRNLGEILVACYLPEQYAAVLKDMADRQSVPSIACRRVLHFEYEELAQAVVLDWGMPESVARSMSDTGGADELHTVVSFAHRLTTAVYRHGPESSSQSVKMLIQKYASLRLSREEVTSMLEAGIEGTRETFALAGVQLNDLQLKKQMSAAMAGTDDAEAQGGAAAAVAAGSGLPPERASRPTSEAKQAVEDGQIEFNTIMLGLLKQAMSAGEFSRAVLLLVSSTRTELYGRLGAGLATEDFVARFRFPLGPMGGSLGVAASRGQELTLSATWELMPEERRLLRSQNAGAVLMVPLVVDGRTIGALYVDSPTNMQVSDLTVAAVRTARDGMVQALARQHLAA